MFFARVDMSASLLGRFGAYSLNDTDAFRGMRLRAYCLLPY